MQVDGIQGVVKGCNGSSFYDAKTVIHEAFPLLRWYWRAFNGFFLDYLHAEVGYYGIYRTSYRTTMYLFVNGVFEHKIVV